uniref:Si:ch211-153l6.6 n=1 Tax=Sinocyclocheilus grahami TaxID=75366 RepID=A0A672T0Y6_SINGR
MYVRAGACHVSGVTVLPLVDSHAFNHSCGLCHTHSHTLTHIHAHRGRNETFTVKPADLKAPSLTRVTAGARRSYGSELNEGKSTSVNQQKKEQEYLSEAVTMETNQLSEMADLTDCKMNPGCTEDQTCQFTEEVNECFVTYFPECLDTKQSNPHEDLDGQRNKAIINECDSSGESDGSKDSQEGITVKVNEQDEPDGRESLAFESHEEPLVNDKPEEEMEINNFDDTQEKEHDEPEERLEAQEESVLEQQINELVISEVPTESCPDMDRDDLSDCLLVEMANISSDSDAEEPWRSLAPSAVDKEEIEENGDLLGMDEAEVNSEDQARQEDIEVTESNAELEDEALALNINESEILEQPECPTECELRDISLDSSAHYCSLTKIAEDEEELGKTSKHNLQRLSCSTSELDKKLPKDFCVVQEIKSENVSTEHLDFRVARKQWQKMEEQTKGLVHRPAMRQASCQGGHNFMYTPVRNIDRPRRDPDIESLGLGDYQYTQFSPCSEDSGLDDTSYRSPYDEPETPVEREIRDALEREEMFRRERTMAKMSAGDTMQIKPKPGVLHHSRSEPGEKRQMFDTPEDRCISQRSPSARTPTLSITASSERSPTYHEMTANNVIILEPDSYTTSPRSQRKGGMLSPGTSSFQVWPSDMNNVIILETSNLIIRSASEFCLSTVCQETQESTFQNNPFFKLRSHSTQSLVDQEIKLVRQREEELRRQRAQLYVKERYDTVLVSPCQLQNFTYEKPGEVPAKSKSSPSSPSKTRKMDRSTLSCDHKFYR